jgi:L-asparaginase/Glu-tRNA(Gln) amidotransferase subunit D
MSENSKTLIIITGGTIEALYSPEEGTPYVVPLPPSTDESAIPELLTRLGVSAQDCVYWKLAMSDSKALAQQGDVMNRIAERIANELCARVIIVQGTDTMPENARTLTRALNQRGAIGARVVFTGAMKPLRDASGNWHPREKTDGWRNMEMALADVASAALPAGVYIEMGEGPWDPKRVEKQVETRAADGGVAYVAHSGFVLLGDADA